MVLLVVFCILTTGAPKSSSSPLNTPDAPEQFSLYDQIDQAMTECTGQALFVGQYPLPDIELCILMAQSFVPTKDVLTRVELFIGKNSTTTYPYHVAIREELAEENIVETTVDASSIPAENFSWVEFDFQNIWVTPGTTYYIVCSTENITDNWYAWGMHNDTDSYLYGCAWMSLDNGSTWTNDSLTTGNGQSHPYQSKDTPTRAGRENTCDMCFITYGLTETQLKFTVKKNFLGPTFLLTNNGTVTAYDVNVSLQVHGGLLGLINKTMYGFLPDLNLTDVLLLEFQPRIFGFGPVDMLAKAHATNAREVTAEYHGFLFLIFYVG